jgi:Rrf2 family nitric oxide-sensitive transcriptional repressor
MRLNLKTDYALRILLHAAKNKEKLITSTEVSERYNITQANVTQIVNALKKKGYLNVKRGRYGGGFTLSDPPEEMRIGNIIKDIEPDLDLVQCFNNITNPHFLWGIRKCKSTTVATAFNVEVTFFLKCIDDLGDVGLSDVVAFRNLS